MPRAHRLIFAAAADTGAGSGHSSPSAISMGVHHIRYSHDDFDSVHDNRMSMRRTWRSRILAPFRSCRWSCHGSRQSSNSVSCVAATPEALPPRIIPQSHESHHGWPDTRDAIVWCCALNRNTIDVANLDKLDQQSGHSLPLRSFMSVGLECE
jgi:hypothetical protein